MIRKAQTDRSKGKGFTLWLMLFAVAIIGLSMNPRPGYAAIVVPPQWTDPTFDTPIDDIYHTYPMDRALREKWMAIFNAMMEQFTTNMMEQVMIIGTFMDAKHQMESQRLMQDLDIQIHKEMAPTTQMCVLGTNVRGLTSSGLKADANAYILGNGLLSRSMLPFEQMTGWDEDASMRSRLEQYVNNYCDPKDNGGIMEPLCNTAATPAPPGRRNKDLNFTSLIDGPLTMDIDFTNNALTNDEEDVLAMSYNLFGTAMFPTIPEDLIREGPLEDMGPGTWIYQNIRSLQAIRGVAQNSFAHLVGMKAQGTGYDTPYLTAIMAQLGMPPDDITKFLGQNPSYFAQMDVLTKRIYMSPNFFVNLFTQPANIERTGVALQAIELMQDRDRFEASLRREMLISMIVEMKLRELEKPVNNTIIGTLPNLLMSTGAAGP